VTTSVDSDGTCTGTATTTGLSINTTRQAGGPVSSQPENATSTATLGKGTPANCPTTDIRFFVQPAGTTTCDIGATQNGAAQQTTTPTCVASAPQFPAGGPATQQVTVTDNLSGLGPESGNPADPGTDPATNPFSSPATPINSDVISGLHVDNGTVAFTAPTAPTRSPLVLTATKTTAGTLTHWWFTATNWAGKPLFCH
jgi:hypothetical protein